MSQEGVKGVGVGKGKGWGRGRGGEGGEVVNDKQTSTFDLYRCMHQQLMHVSTVLDNILNLDKILKKGYKNVYVDLQCHFSMNLQGILKQIPYSS